MKNLCFLFSFVSIFCFSQNYKELSKQICDSSKSVSTRDSLTNFEKQTSIFTHFITKKLKNFEQNIDKANVDTFQNKINLLNYNVVKNLGKECESFFIKDYFFLPNTVVFDGEKIFKTFEFKSIERELKSIRKDKKINLFIVTAEDFDPYSDITEYSFKILEKFYSTDFIKASVIIVLSKNLRQIRISTDAEAKKMLSDDYLQTIIDQQMIPKFKDGNYFEGITIAIAGIKKNI